MSPPDLYTAQQVEEIAKCAAQYAVEHFLKPSNLENGIQRDVVADIGGETMASNHKERYYYTTSNGSIECKVIYGKDKKDTDFKFKIFLEEQLNSKPHAPLLVDFINNSYRKSFMRKLAPTTVTNYNNYIDRYILPVLGDKHMDMITVEDVQLLYDWMAQARKHGCQKMLDCFLYNCFDTEEPPLIRAGVDFCHRSGYLFKMRCPCPFIVYSHCSFIAALRALLS